MKQRIGGGRQKLDYVAIETVLERLLEVAPDYSIENGQVALFEVPIFGEEDEHGNAPMIGMRLGGAYASLELVIDGKRAFGVGAMQNPDIDMAVKSAVSEAIKNAAKNGFGVALELWDEGHRETLKRQRMISSSVAAMKREVFRLATEKLGHAPTKGSEVAKVFGVKAGDLGDMGVLRSILEKEGVL